MASSKKARKKNPPPRKPKASSWVQHFRQEIIASFMAPRLQSILMNGVTSKADLVNKFEDVYGVRLNNEALNELLRETNLLELFKAPQLIRIDNISQPAAPIPAPARDFLAPQEPIVPDPVPEQEDLSLPPGVREVTEPSVFAGSDGPPAVAGEDASVNRHVLPRFG
jgi:hypothetical protein